MSGLIGFFKEFLPNVTNIDHGRRWEDLTLSEKSEEVMQQDNGDTSDPILAALSRPPVKPLLDYVPEKLTFTEWRRLTRRFLQDFYQLRWITQEDEDQDSDGSKEESDDNHYEDWNDDSEYYHHQDEDVDVDQDEESGGNELALASQPAIPDINHGTEPTTPKKRRKWRVPPLYQAIHSVQSLQYLDLRTKDISLDLCMVTKIWKLRETKRGYKYMSSGEGQCEQQLCCLFSGRMPRVTFGNLDDDGPLSPTYKYVLSLEVEQLVSIDSRQQQPSTAAFGQRKRAIRLFLYDGYAKAVSQWMGKQSKSFLSNRNTAGTVPVETNSAGYILSLFKVPALSIFPHALDPRDWWDQEHVVPYCICLGDSSNMMAMSKEGDTTILLRADSDEVELRLAKTASGSTIRDSSELVLSKRLLAQPARHAQGDDEEIPPPSLLRTRWKQYCQSVPWSLPPVQQQQQQQPSVVQIEAQSPSKSAAIPSNQPLPSNASDSATQVPTTPCSPPPSLPSKRPIEPMVFVPKRPRLEHSTNNPKPDADSPPAVEYVNLVLLKDLYEEYKERNPNIHRYLHVNAYGVVLGFTVPIQTKRGDWMVSATLVDESCTVPVTLVIFATNESKLPQFQQTGDVIRIQKVALQSWRDEVQLSGRKTSSYVVIRRSSLQLTGIDPSTLPTTPTVANHPSPTPHWTVIPAGTTEYSFEESDEERSQSLWHWGQQQLREHPMIIHPEHKFTLGEMVNLKDEDYGDIHDRDLIVLVTGIIPYPTDQVNAITAYGFLRVWDGTGSINDPIPIPSADAIRIRESEGEPPRQVVTKVASIIQEYRGVNAASLNSPNNPEDATRENNKNNIQEDLEIPGVLCGKVANVVIWERAHWKLVCNHISVGTFIRLRNVGVRRWQDHAFHSLMVHSKSWLSPLPDNTFEIRTLLEQHNKRLKRKEFNVESGLRPLSGSNNPGPTTIPNQRDRTSSIPLGTGLADYLAKSLQPPTQPAKRIPHKKDTKDERFCGVVRLVEPTFPEFKGDLRVFCNIRNGRHVYQCGMTVTDESSVSLEVIVPHHLAERIFGVSAQSAAKGNECRQTPFDSDAAWKVSIYGAIKAGRRFFVMTDISLTTENPP